MKYILLSLILFTLPANALMNASHFLNASQCLKGAYSFDGTGDWVHMIGYKNPPTTGDMTLTVWAKSDTATLATAGLAGWLKQAGVDRFGIYKQSGGYWTFLWYIDTVSFTVVSSKLVVADEWVFLVFTIDRDGDLVAYADGVEVARTDISSSSAYTFNPPVDFALGQYYDFAEYPANYFDGTISETRLYDVALTATEAADLYNLGRNPPYTPVAWYRMDGDATDSAGTNDGTVKGAVNTTDPFDLPPCKPLAEVCEAGSYDFSGSDNINIGDNTAMDGATALTVSAWVYPEGTPSGFAEGIYTKSGGVGDRVFSFVRKADDTAYFFMYHNGGVVGGNYDGFNTTASLSLSQWSLVTAVWSAGVTPKIYINGVDQAGSQVTSGIKPTSFYNSTGDFMIGDADSQGWAFNGKIADVRAYSEALTATEIFDLYTYGREPDDTNLEAHYEMAWSDPAGDSSPNANNGTVTGAIYSDQIEDVPPCRNFKAKNPVAEYKFDAGAQDTSGNFLDGTLNGGMATPAGTAVFDGTDDYISASDNASINVGAGDFTASLWLSSERQNVVQGILIKGAVGSGGKRYMIQKSQFNFYGINIDDNSTVVSVESSAIADSAWHHIVGVRDGSNLRLYIDGVEATASPVDCSAVGNIDDASFPLILGAQNNFTTGIYRYFDGQIDNTRIYDRALSADEILKLYSEGHD